MAQDVMTRDEAIESKLNMTTAGAMPVSDAVGGIRFSSMADVMEFAKLMSLSKNAVPAHLRANPGACLAVTIQSLEWRMSPFAVANKSFEVNGRIAYESQLIHAVVEARAPLKQRLRPVYKGEGDALTCNISGLIKGEAEPLVYDSPEIGKITIKNSPLWKTDPQQQLWYYSVRAWARRYVPDVLLGIYAEDELDRERPGDRADDVTPAGPGIAARLGQKGTGGFQAANVAALDEKAKPDVIVDKATVDAPVTASAAQDTKEPKSDAGPADGPTHTVEKKPEPENPMPGHEKDQADAPKMDLESDLDGEVESKIRALAACETANDVKFISDEVLKLLRKTKRKDLREKFLQAAKTNEDRVNKAGKVLL